MTSNFQLNPHSKPITGLDQPLSSLRSEHTSLDSMHISSSLSLSLLYLTGPARLIGFGTNSVSTCMVSLLDSIQSKCILIFPQCHSMYFSQTVQMYEIAYSTMELVNVFIIVCSSSQIQEVLLQLAGLCKTKSSVCCCYNKAGPIYAIMSPSLLQRWDTLTVNFCLFCMDLFMEIACLSLG